MATDKTKDFEAGLMAQDPKVKGVPFTCIYNGDEQLYVSSAFQTDELTYYFVIKTMYGDEIGDGEWPKHILTLSVVSPTYLNKRELRRAWESMGSHDYVPETDADLVEMLQGYGHAARIAEIGGGNRSKIYARLTKEATVCTGLFGFYIDRCVNRMSNTGWDALRGTIGIFSVRPEDVAEEQQACAELVACFALAGLDADPDESIYGETDAELLENLAGAFVRDWLIAHPYKRRKQRAA